MAAWYEYDIGHGYITNFQGDGTDTPHYAYDIETPFHTPLTAPLAGTVKKADYAAWGGEIFVQPDDKRLPEYYFYHPDEVDVRPGEHVNAGQLLALSGGENPGFPGAEHPAATQWSTGPHTHMGWFTNWTVTPDGTRPYGPEPHALIEDAKGIGNGGGGLGIPLNAFNVPSDIYNAVEPIAKSQGVPDSLWETVASVESAFNTQAVGDNGTSFGLFQLHRGGQLGNLTEQQAFNPTTNAQTAMPSISSAWKNLEPTFNANSLQWWEQFAAESGHPGGSPGQTVTDNEARTLMNTYNTDTGVGGPQHLPSSNAGAAASNTGNPIVDGIVNGFSGIFTTSIGTVQGDITQEVTTIEGDISKAFGSFKNTVAHFAIRGGVGIIGVLLVNAGVLEIVAALRGETPMDMGEDIASSVPVVGDTLKGGMQKADRLVRGNRAASGSNKSSTTKKKTTKKTSHAKPKQEKAPAPETKAAGAGTTVEKGAADVAELAAA